MPYEILELTDEQKAKVDSLYKDTKIGDMVPLVFGPEYKADGRTTEGRSIQAYIASKGEKVITSKHIMAKDTPTELTDDHKAQIEKLAPRCKTTLELCHTVFGDPTLTTLSKQFKLTWDYVSKIYPDAINPQEEPVEESVYKPPLTVAALIPIVNRWVSAGRPGQKAYHWGKLKASDERCLDRLMGYIRVYSFVYTASQYERQVDRDLFISQFMRWAHDKPDLTEIEVDQMIMAAAERVNIAQIDREIQRISKMHDEIMAGGEKDENGKVRKLSMTDVELINAVRTKFDASKKRLSDLMSDLEQVRSKRLDAQKSKYGSVLDILDAFNKDEDARNRVFLDEGISEKKEDEEEVERLTGVDELWALVSGQSAEEGKA